MIVNLRFKKWEGTSWAGDMGSLPASVAYTNVLGHLYSLSKKDRKKISTNGGLIIVGEEK